MEAVALKWGDLNTVGEVEGEDFPSVLSHGRSGPFHDAFKWRKR